MLIENFVLPNCLLFQIDSIDSLVIQKMASEEKMPAAKGIKVLRPKLLTGLEDLLGMYRKDLCVLERVGRSGRPTFALGMDRGGREFPTVIQGDVPMREIKRFVEIAKKGARILSRVNKNYPDFEGVLAAHNMGQECLIDAFFIP